MCKCKAGFTVFNSSCLPICDEGIYSATGICTAATCPAGSHEVETSSGDEGDGGDEEREASSIFWGHCECNDGFWVPSKQRCMNACPYYAEFTSSQTGNVSDGWCTCRGRVEVNDNPDDVEYWVPKPDHSDCQQCPDGSTGVNQDGTKCICPNNKVYRPSCNKCLFPN